jgi:hypothetical protein
MFVAGAVTVGRPVPNVKFVEPSTLCYPVHNGVVLEGVETGQQARSHVGTVNMYTSFIIVADVRHRSCNLAQRSVRRLATPLRLCA